MLMQRHSQEDFCLFPGAARKSERLRARNASAADCRRSGRAHVDAGGQKKVLTVHIRTVTAAKVAKNTFVAEYTGGGRGEIVMQVRKKNRGCNGPETRRAEKKCHYAGLEAETRKTVVQVAKTTKKTPVLRASATKVSSELESKKASFPSVAPVPLLASRKKGYRRQTPLPLVESTRAPAESIGFLAQIGKIIRLRQEHGGRHSAYSFFRRSTQTPLDGGGT